LARKILLADDSVTAQNMGRKILTDAGYEVITVNNGSAALKKIAEGKPDLIVLDVYMPGYSGLEVCQRIKENRETARIPILLTVGKLEPFKPEEARRARADAFVVKPFEASELLSALTKLEDKIIPGAEPYKPGRFAKAIASVEQSDSNQFGDSDEGWKARLRIPTGKPKQPDNEPPVDYSATQGKGFRDIAEPGKKTEPKPAAASNFERPVPAGLPHDITSEEIAAITAAAAQLKAGTPVKHETTAEIEPPTVAAQAETDAAVPDASAEETAPVTFASAPEMETPVMPVEAPPQTADVEIPAAEVPVEIQRSPVVSEIPTEADQVTPEASVPPATEVSATVPTSAEDAEVPSTSPQEIVAEAAAEEFPAPAEPVSIASAVAPQPEPTTVSENATLANSPAPVADEEVMAALHALIPADSQAAEAAVSDAGASLGPDVPLPSPESVGPRWMAEEVTLSQDEASVVLDREMEMMAAARGVQEAAQPESTETVVAVASAPETSGQGEVYAVATAAGAEFPAPWPLTNSTGEVPVAETSSVIPTEIISGKAEVPAGEGHTQASIENDPFGGTETMAANWKNIRDSIAGSAAKPAPAKEEFIDRSDAAASDASSPEPASSSADVTKPSASDPTAIANIVESVLAELRPKIVEEITRKLSDPKK